MDIHVFMNIGLQLSILLWISIWISLDFYGYPCIDLLWILDLWWTKNVDRLVEQCLFVARGHFSSQLALCHLPVDVTMTSNSRPGGTIEFFY